MEGINGSGKTNQMDMTIYSYGGEEVIKGIGDIIQIQVGATIFIKMVHILI